MALTAVAENSCCGHFAEVGTNGTKQWVGAGYVINTDPDKLVDQIIEGIEAKRAALGI